MTREKFKKILQSQTLTMKDLRDMTPKQRIEIRKNSNRYVTDSKIHNIPDFLGAFIREVVNSKGTIIK